MLSRICWILFSFMFAGTLLAQEIEIKAELMGRLSTQSSRKGDRFFARAISPDGLKGDMVEGTVRDVRSGGKMRSQSVLTLGFETLQHGGQSISIASQVKSVTNSKGQADVDEEGRAVRKTNNVGKAAAGAGAGGLIGGIVGGGKGALIGAGAGAAASVVFIEFAADGPEIRLDPGSTVTLSAQSKSGPSLAGLVPSSSPSASAGPAEAAASKPAAAPASSPSAPAQSAAASVNQPDLTTIKADFIPGEKTIFYDDFSDMAGDEPPPHWKVRGAGLALKAGGGIRQLTATGKSTLTPNLKTLPKNFTVETEVKFDNPGDLRSIWSFFPKGNTDNEALQIVDPDSLRKPHR